MIFQSLNHTVESLRQSLIDCYIHQTYGRVLSSRNVLTCRVRIASLAVEQSQIVTAVHVDVSVVGVWRRRTKPVWKKQTKTTSYKWNIPIRNLGSESLIGPLNHSHRSSSCRWRSSDLLQCSRGGRGWTSWTVGRGTSSSRCLKRQRAGWSTCLRGETSLCHDVKATWPQWQYEANRTRTRDHLSTRLRLILWAC